VGERWNTGRTEAFSDGVFAIAATLLVFDLNLPEHAFGDIWGGFAHEWPSYLAFVTSFITIGAVWLAHHGIFVRLRYVDQRTMRLNLLLLLVVCFLPFPTRVAGEAIRNTSAERGAVIVYGATLLATVGLIAALWTGIARHRELLRPEVSEAEVARITSGVLSNCGFYLGAIVLALFVPRVAFFLYLVIAVVGLLRTGGDDDVRADDELATGAG
jgi:uncharacterized membrane protein